MSNYIASSTDLTAVANAIRAKSGGSSQLAFPTGFVSEIGNISAGAPLPSGVTKISGGTFTFASNTALTAQIPHDLGVVPKAVVVWASDSNSNDTLFHSGALIACRIDTSGNTYYAMRNFSYKSSASAADASYGYLFTSLSDALSSTFFSFNNGSRYYLAGATYNWVAFA